MTWYLWLAIGWAIGSLYGSALTQYLLRRRKGRR